MKQMDGSSDTTPQLTVKAKNLIHVCLDKGYWITISVSYYIVEGLITDLRCILLSLYVQCFHRAVVIQNWRHRAQYSDTITHCRIIIIEQLLPLDVWRHELYPSPCISLVNQYSTLCVVGQLHTSVNVWRYMHAIRSLLVHLICILLQLYAPYKPVMDCIVTNLIPCVFLIWSCLLRANYRGIPPSAVFGR